MVGDLLPAVAEEEHAQGGDLLGAGQGPAHAGSFHAVGAEVLAGALGQATAHLVAPGQEGRVGQLRGAVGEVGGGLAGRLRSPRGPVGVLLGQGVQVLAERRDLTAGVVTLR